MSEGRVLVTHCTLPEYLTSAARIANLDSDIREATAKMKAALTEKSHQFTTTGYVLDDESWELAANGRTIVLTVKVRRP